MSFMRTWRSAVCVADEGSVVPPDANRSVYVDQAAAADVHRSARLFDLISCFLALMYVLRTLISRSVAPTFALESSVEDRVVGSPKACSSCAQYQSQSQSSAVRAARLISAKEGICRWTIQ